MYIGQVDKNERDMGNEQEAKLGEVILFSGSYYGIIRMSRHGPVSILQTQMNLLMPLLYSFTISF